MDQISSLKKIILPFKVRFMNILGKQNVSVNFLILIPISQWAFGDRMTSYPRRCDVITSHRRGYDVILSPNARWVLLLRKSAYWSPTSAAIYILFVFMNTCCFCGFAAFVAICGKHSG